MNLYEMISEQSRAKGERNDCAVKAIAIASGLSYDRVHSALAKNGRRKGRGCNWLVQVPVLNDLGVQFKVIDVYSTQYNRRTMKTIGKVLPRGRYLVYVRGHVAALIDGKIEDWTDNRRHKVKTIIQVEAHPDSGLIDRGKVDDCPYVDQWGVVEPKPAPKPRNRGAGDEVSQILRDYLDGPSTAVKGRKLDELADIFGLNRYSNLNVGQRRMNMGNRLRSMVKRGELSIDGLRSMIRISQRRVQQ